ncbi:cyanophycinase [Pontibacter rugosus]|uniref:Cyanophycinase n=1 Tax=Pontibacter rugosus TaxID=1745966 RepID=A0ABW3SLX1_9BACT
MAKRKVSDRHEYHKEAPVPKGCILAIGGKESKGDGDLKDIQERNKTFESEEILKFFVDKLPGDNPVVVLVPTASAVPDEMIKMYQDAFAKLGHKHLEVLDIRTRLEALNPAHLEVVERANGIFFTGGDQLRITSILGGTAVLELMKERYTYDDILIAGTSAGATALSTPMIYEVKTKGGFLKGDVRITTGLEFIKNVAIDTHFIERGRIVRMAQAITTNPGCIGIGLEEDTAIYVTEGRELEVLGSGLLTIVDGMRLTSTNISEIGSGEPFSVRDLKVHLLAGGERYTIKTYDQLHL